MLTFLNIFRSRFFWWTTIQWVRPRRAQVIFCPKIVLGSNFFWNNIHVTEGGFHHRQWREEVDLVGKWLSVSMVELLCLQIHGEFPFGENHLAQNCGFSIFATFCRWLSKLLWLSPIRDQQSSSVKRLGLLTLEFSGNIVIAHWRWPLQCALCT